MKKWLSAAYPMPGSEGHKKGIVLSTVIGLFIFLFLYIFAPFGLDTAEQMNPLLFCAGYGLITCAVVLIFLNVIPFTLLKNYNENKWTYLNELLYLLLMLFSIAIANYIYTVQIFPAMQYSMDSFLSILMGTFLVAFFPTTFFVAIDLVRNEKNFKQDSDILNSDKTAKPKVENSLTFKSDYDEKDLVIPQDHFLFAEADANYVSFYYVLDNNVQRSILRTSLKKVEYRLIDIPIISRTHRSFLVNLDRVSNFDGNAQGFTLFFENTDKQAKVSRSYTKQVKELLKA